MKKIMKILSVSLAAFLLACIIAACDGTERFTLTVSGGTIVNNGAVSGTFKTGTEVTVTADTSGDKVFVAWYEGATEVSTDNPWKFELTKSMSLTAIFDTSIGGGCGYGDIQGEELADAAAWGKAIEDTLAAMLSAERNFVVVGDAARTEPGDDAEWLTLSLTYRINAGKSERIYISTGYGCGEGEDAWHLVNERYTEVVGHSVTRFRRDILNGIYYPWIKQVSYLPESALISSDIYNAIVLIQLINVPILSHLVFEAFEESFEMFEFADGEYRHKEFDLAVKFAGGLLAGSRDESSEVISTYLYSFGNAGTITLPEVPED
jgi:hypothetical protein